MYQVNTPWCTADDVGRHRKWFHSCVGERRK